MGSTTEILTALALAAAKEGYEYAKRKLRKVANESGLVVSDEHLEALLGAQLVTMHGAMAAMYAHIVRLKDIADEAERQFRASSNVEVVDELPKDE